ncbi:MAG TPA: HAD family phosphatase, partial [Vicinamibacterales bacterium]|nr:HAD family phosphatase [Vicinamibacterales bacterium]
MRAVVFDFDGVLADSEPLHLAATQEIFASLGLELTREEYCARYLGLDDNGMFAVMADVHGLRLDPVERAGLVARKAAIFDELMARADVLYPNAAACVERLARDFPLGIASGALRHEIEMVLRRAGILHHFRFIVSSGDTPRSKPAPDPYVRAAALHGLPGDACVAVEDSPVGVRSAKSAGLACVGITTNFPAADLRAADRTIASLDELTAGLI